MDLLSLLISLAVWTVLFAFFIVALPSALWPSFKWRKPSRKKGAVVVELGSGKQTPVRETEGGKLYAKIQSGICPDCFSTGFYAGPSGGMSQNIYCCNSKCRSAFNVTPLALLGDPNDGTAERIGKAPTWFHYPEDKDAKEKVKA